MTRVKEKVAYQVRTTPEARREIDRIGDEWRMNITATIDALIELWNNSTDEQKVNAIRRPVRAPEMAAA